MITQLILIHVYIEEIEPLMNLKVFKGIKELKLVGGSSKASFIQLLMIHHQLVFIYNNIL